MKHYQTNYYIGPMKKVFS